MGEQFVDVQYRGLEVGRRQKMHDFGPTTAYLQHPTPLPVGTRLEIHTDEGARLAVSVLRVQEQVAGAERQPGAFVAVGELDDAGRAWWAAQVSVADPIIPEVIPAATAEEAAPADEGAAEVTPVETADDSAEAKPAPAKRKRRARASKGAAADDKKNDKAAAPAADTASSDAATDDGDGKRKRRGRRKKKS